MLNGSSVSRCSTWLRSTWSPSDCGATSTTPLSPVASVLSVAPDCSASSEPANINYASAITTTARAPTTVGSNHGGVEREDCCVKTVPCNSTQCSAEHLVFYPKE